MPDDDSEDLKGEIIRLLEAALKAEENHVDQLGRRDEIHVGEVQRRDELHVGELVRRDDLHRHELEQYSTALETRDIIGQAKGVIMATMHCDADAAYALLVKQSQAENRKLREVAAEIAHRAARRRR